MEREQLDVNKLVYATDIDTMLVDCEGTEVWPQDSDGCEYYYKSQADAVMNAMETRIKELEAENERLKSIVCDEEYKNGLSGLAQRNAELRDENERLKAQVPKWISVKDRLPSNQEIVFGLVVGTDLVTKDWTPELNERIKRTELCYYVDGDGWYSSEGYQMVVSPRMWMSLPPPPTTEESSATEKENG